MSTSTAALLSPSNDQLQGTVLRDLGEHRLKDLAAPERIYQLGDGEFPPLKSLYRTNLPVPATAFLGRETELAEVAALFARPDVRLLTLTGPGGTGKTRLALQAAAALADLYPDGVYWVPLAPLRDPALVLEEAAQAVGAKDDLAQHVADKHLLLLFDNFEHLIDAADGLPDLLATCPNLRVVVTSREPLHVSGEQEYAVAPLAEKDGVSLFLARARAVKPAFDGDGAVAEICRRLDELPLALELAAARVKALSAQQILERLEQRLPLLTGGARDLPERQRTLRATIEWSHDLLREDEQRLFARLAVFRGGCTLDAAEHVCDADLDTIQSLVDKSLLRHTGERYWMLETIREYAVEQLDASGEADELRQRHAAYFLARAEEAETHVEKDPEQWLPRLEESLDNFRAALDHFDEAGDSDRFLRLAGALLELWEASHVNEGRQRLERALSIDVRPTAARAKGVAGVARLARGGGDAATTRLRAAEAVDLYRDLGDARGAVHAKVTLGLALADEGDFVEAGRIFEECLGVFHHIGDEGNALFAARLLGWVYEEVGDDERARSVLEQTLDRARVLQNRQIEGQTLAALGYHAVKEGRAAEALSLYEAALRIDRELGYLLQMYFDLSRLARALALVGDAPEKAALLLAAGETIRDMIGAGTPPFVAETRAEALASARAQLGDAAFAEAWKDGKALSADEAIALALGESVGNA